MSRAGDVDRAGGVFALAIAPKRARRAACVRADDVRTSQRLRVVIAGARAAVPCHGSANATYASPASGVAPGSGFTASLPPPVAAMTTYCLPFTS